MRLTSFQGHHRAWKYLIIIQSTIMKKNYLLSLLFAVIMISACRKSMDEPGNIALSKQTKDELATQSSKNKKTILISNGDFEKRTDFDTLRKRDEWMKQGWKINSGIFSWGKKTGRNNTGGISLEAGGGIPNDIAVIQQIILNPAKLYRLSAWVKTENVIGGAGANICLFGTWVKSKSVTGTTDWQLITVDLPPSSGAIIIGCRLGYWAAVSTGKAYFDDVSIEELSKFVEVGQHVSLVLDEEDASAVSAQTITSWIANLDKAYEKYYELMGAYPYNGDRITIFSVSDYPGGWAVAGNPILWYKPYIKSELQSIASTGTWSFGIMHELGHDFMLDNSNKNWIFNEEMFANFRMYYVVEKLNATIVEGGLYHGSELENYYKTDAIESYANKIAKGIPQGYDGLMYTLIRIKNQVGWEAVLKTIRDLNASSTASGTRWQMFNLLLDKLTLYSGQDVRKTYPAGELNVIQQLVVNS